MKVALITLNIELIALSFGILADGFAGEVTDCIAAEAVALVQPEADKLSRLREILGIGVGVDAAVGGNVVVAAGAVGAVGRV